ncbi:hypothetical protein K9F62_11260 [Desulfovibrio sp. JY]|nr:hypothetical protein K9F62_11260 [Desulfovibrio sp. JY]
MKHKVFSFYTEEEDVLKELTMWVSLCCKVKFAEENLSRIQRKGKHKKDYRPLFVIYNEFMNGVVSRLKSDTFLKLSSTVVDLINALDKDLIMDGVDLEVVFSSVLNSLVSNAAIDDRLIDILYENVVGDEKICFVRSGFLLKTFGFNIDVTKEYFEKIRSLDNSKVKEIFSCIAIKGMKSLSSDLIEMIEECDNRCVSVIRFLAETYCIYIELLRDTLSFDDNRYDGLNILALMSAANHEGKIIQECKFYSNESFEVMASLGTSFKMRKEQESKNELYNQASEEMERRYASGQKILHNQMVDEILKEQKFKKLKKYRLLPMAQGIAASRGLVRGKKDGGKDD